VDKVGFMSMRSGGLTPLATVRLSLNFISRVKIYTLDRKDEVS
jgi:hypothetical protein